MYIYRRFRTTKSVVTILVVALALGILAIAHKSLAKKPDNGGEEDVTYTVSYTQSEGTDLFDLGGYEVTLSDDTKVFNLRTQLSDLSSLGGDWVDHDGEGWLQVARLKKDPIGVELRYWFTDTNTGSEYLLTMPGKIMGEWLSATEPTVIESSGGDWKISAKVSKDEESGPDLGWGITLTPE